MTDVLFVSACVVVVVVSAIYLWGWIDWMNNGSH